MRIGVPKEIKVHEYRVGLIHDGKITHPAVAEALGLPYTPAEVVVGTASAGARA